MRGVVLPLCVTTQPLVRNRSSAVIRQNIERGGWKVALAAKKGTATRLQTNSARASASPGEKEEMPDFERLPSAKEVISREPLTAGHWLDAWI